MLLPYVQSALNQQPSNRLGGVAPTTAFTRLPAASPLSYLIHPELPIEAQIDWVNDACKHHLSELAASLDQLHKTVSAKSDKKRAQARNRRLAKKNVKMPNFTLGDFVLVSKALQLPNKLALRWSGPARIVQVITDHIMEVEQVAPPPFFLVRHTMPVGFAFIARMVVKSPTTCEAR
ncbi:hypothetical protein AeRB84_009528 [Aphanomyces euteiches]|nr:hypothetical protein AeRB84_009528 [Aphanomyces euteiches]